MPSSKRDSLLLFRLAHVAERRQLHRRNLLTIRSGKGPLVRFLLQFHQPLIYVLLIAAAVTAWLKEPMWAIAWLSNVWLPVGVLAMLLLQFAFKYVTFMNQIFHSKPVDGLAWTAATAVAIAVYSIVGFEKWLRFGRSHRETENPRITKY